MLADNRRWRPVFKRLRPFVLFMMLMTAVYILFSVLFTAINFQLILIRGSFALAKLVLMVAVMSLYFEISRTGAVIDALRTIWHKTGRSWQWVDDAFLFLELTLRFFPGFQRDWERVSQARRGLGLTGNFSRWATIRQLVHDLPAQLTRSLQMADDTALSMQLRGYGRVTPRGVAFPVPFTWTDGLLGILVSAAFILWIIYVAL